MTFDILRARVRQREEQRFERAMQIQLMRAQSEAPNLSGVLAESFVRDGVTSTPTSWEEEIGSDLIYAGVTDLGHRGPFTISTRTEPVLSDGEYFFGTEVTHPGNPGTRWWTDEIATESAWREALEQAGAELGPITT